MKALLTNFLGSEAKTKEYIYECKTKDIKVLNPSILSSDNTFRIDNNAIRFPLLGIKGIGNNACNFIIEERNKICIRYKCIVQCDDMLALTLYKKIEKRGFRVENNKSRKILNEHYIIESNVWKLSFDERE